MPIDMQQAWLLTAIPLFAFVVVSLFGKRVPRQGDWIVALAGFACFAISIMFIIDFCKPELLPGNKWYSYQQTG